MLNAKEAPAVLLKGRSVSSAEDSPISKQANCVQRRIPNKPRQGSWRRLEAQTVRDLRRAVEVLWGTVSP